jgi:hypothetical protein
MKALRAGEVAALRFRSIAHREWAAIRPRWLACDSFDRPVDMTHYPNRGSGLPDWPKDAVAPVEADPSTSHVVSCKGAAKACAVKPTSMVGHWRPYLGRVVPKVVRSDDPALTMSVSAW